MRRTYLKSYRVFGGEDSERDDRDLGRFARKTRNLVPGPDGADLRTPPGLVRLHSTALGDLAGLGSNAGSASWGRLGLVLSRFDGAWEKDVLGLMTQFHPWHYGRLLRRLSMRDRKKAIPSSLASLTLAATKQYQVGLWDDGGLTPDGFAMDLATLDADNPTTNNYADPQTVEGWYGIAPTEKRAVLLRLGEFLGDAATDPTDTSDHQIPPNVTITKATLRGVIASRSEFGAPGSTSTTLLMTFSAQRLASRAADYWTQDEVTWNLEKTGSSWSSAGCLGNELAGAARASAVYRYLSLAVGESVEFDVMYDVQDYLDNASAAEVLQFRISGEIAAYGTYTAGMAMWRIGFDEAEWTLDVEYEYEYDPADYTETEATEGVQKSIPWDAVHGPVSQPWLAEGHGLVLWGHSGARPRGWWGSGDFAAGLKPVYRLDGSSLPVGPDLTAGTATTNIPAGTYEYVVTRYDATLGRGGAVCEASKEQVVLAADGQVTLAATIFNASSDERYTHYRVWRRVVDVGGTSSAEFYLVADLDAATQEAPAAYVDTLATPESTVLTPARYSMPAFSGCVFHRGRFWGWDLQPWKIPGTTVGVANDSQVVTPGEAPWFGDWLSERTILLQKSDDSWASHLIDLVYEVGGETRLWLAEALDDSGATGTAHWEVTGSRNTVYLSDARPGNAEGFRLDGTTEIELDEGDGDRIVGALPLADRLMCYKRNSVVVLEGGAFADADGEDDQLNDLDYYVMHDGSGLVGPGALCADAAGRHFFFDGIELRVNTGDGVTDVTRGRLRRWLREEVDQSRLDEVVVEYDAERNWVWLVGFFRTGGTRPGPAVVYDVSTDAVAPLEYFGASGAFAQDGRMVFGMSLGFWAMAHDAIGTQQVAFGWGRVSSADATTLTDLAARWDDDAFNALFEGSGMEVRVLRDGAVDQQEEITDVSGGTQLSVASWPDETPMAGQDYFLVPPDWSGVADSGSDVRTILDADVVLKAFDDAQAGTVVALVRPSTGAVQVVSLSTNGYQSLSLWDVDGRLLAAYPAEIDVAEGDLYVVGSWVWTWRQTLVPEGGRMVRARRMILDATAEGADGGDMIVVVRIYASGTDRGEPTLQDTLVLDSSGSNDLILDDWVQLPRYWGRVVWLEIVGVCKDQRVRVRGVEVEVEER